MHFPQRHPFWLVFQPTILRHVSCLEDQPWDQLCGTSTMNGKTNRIRGRYWNRTGGKRHKDLAGYSEQIPGRRNTVA